MDQGAGVGQSGAAGGSGLRLCNLVAQTSTKEAFLPQLIAYIPKSQISWVLALKTKGLLGSFLTNSFALVSHLRLHCLHGSTMYRVTIRITITQFSRLKNFLYIQHRTYNEKKDSRTTGG